MKHSISKLFLSFVLAFCAVSSSIAGDDQTKQTRISSNGDFTVTIESWMKPLRLGRMHAWEAEIKDADGNAVEDAEIKIGGGMPIHNHGFPTQPVMTKQTAPGKYLLEGFKFSMGGPWLIYLDIKAGDRSDSVAFDINM